MYAKHTVFYDRLPHYFMEFDIFDKKERQFFSTAKRKEILGLAPFVLLQTDLCGVMEGIYIKVEEKDYVIDRLKYVRPTFLNAILDSESHWMARPIVANKLAGGASLF